jgi:energy-coupling factor transporter ATP-binding protein EcfA2
MIEANGLTKRYGSTVAVDDLSFTVPPGQVTGFLGPNGAGKSTTMRLILGLDAPDSGAVTVGGRPYAARRRPLFHAGEYGSGMIRATLAAVPQRRLMLTAKALVLTAAAAATGIAACLAAYLVFQAFLPAGDAMRTTLADPGVLRAVSGAGLYLTVLALLGFGLGTVFRSSAGAVAVLVGVLFVPTLLTALLPSSWQDTLGPYLPMNAGDTIYTIRPEAHVLGPWPGFGVFCCTRPLPSPPGSS